MFELKKILEDIVYVAYKDSEKLSLYKKFYIEFLQKDLKSKNGQYNEKEHKITIYNLSRSDSVIIKTSIHELAHHVDTINRGTSDHSQAFYDIYKELLIAALNMKLFSKDLVLEGNTNSSDHSKVAKILNEWIPKYVAYREKEITFIIYNSYEIRNNLKNNDYKYNSINQTWKKTIDDCEREKEIEFLESLSAEYKIVKANEVSVEAVGYLVANGETYSCRDILKKNGFFFSDKKWRKKINLQNKEKEINTLRAYSELSDIVFKIGK